MRITARKQLQAVVSATITNDAAQEMGLTEGVPVTALFNASHVLVGVPV